MLIVCILLALLCAGLAFWVWAQRRSLREAAYRLRALEDTGSTARVRLAVPNSAAEELLDEQAPSFDPRLDPKCCWALRHPEIFPVEVNRADYEALLRVPGLGVVSARRILTARRTGPLRLENLPKLGVVMKRAQYFLTANGRMADGLRFTQDSLLRNLIAVEQSLLPQPEMRQLSLFDDAV